MSETICYSMHSLIFACLVFVCYDNLDGDNWSVVLFLFVMMTWMAIIGWKARSHSPLWFMPQLQTAFQDGSTSPLPFSLPPSSLLSPSSPSSPHHNHHHHQGCTNCGSLAAGLRGNGERMRKWRGNGERMRKWRGNGERMRKWRERFTLKISSFSVYFLPLYPFPISEIVTFCRKMLNTALLSRISQKINIRAMRK